MNQALKPTKKEIVTEFRTREILAAARRLVQKLGAEAVTMEEIAAAAGVAKGTVYLYFHGKEDLIQALISQVGENMLAGIEAIVAGPGSPPEKIQQVASLLLDYLMRERALFPAYARDILRRGRGASPAYWQHLQEMEENFVNLVTRLFAAGIESGQFIPADPRLLTFLLRGMVRAVGYYQMEEGQTEAVQEALPVVLTLLSAGMTRQSQSSAEVPVV
ncbi:MAG: TetR/AcrR family transcriptional regulator [Deltaproteobacteria bacterium]|nr:TetR/AcrR family transcriptional regulator [Deltaproteobacteria bacterium]